MSDLIRPTPEEVEARANCGMPDQIAYRLIDDPDTDHARLALRYLDSDRPIQQRIGLLLASELPEPRLDVLGKLLRLVDGPDPRAARQIVDVCISRSDFRTALADLIEETNP